MKTIMKLTLLASLALTLSLPAAPRPLLKNADTGELIEGFSTGSKRITIGGTGSLEFIDGSTIIGGDWLKTQLSLNNVEDTALSLWEGTNNITTLGTIATGTWQGSIIAPAYLGTGSSITTKFLRGDGTWQTISTGLTVGTTAISGASANDLLISNGSALQKLKLGAGIYTWLGSPTEPNLKAAQSGLAWLDTTQAFTQPQTVSVAGGTTGELLGANVGGVSRFSVDAEDGVTCGYYSSFGVGTNRPLRLKGQYGTLDITSGGAGYFFNGDIRMYSLSVSDGAVLHSARLTYSPNTDGCLELHNFTTAQIFRVYRSFGSPDHYGSLSHYERLALQSGSDYVEVAAETMGDGADDLHVRLTPAGAGGVVIGVSGTPHNKIKSGVATLVAGTVTVSDSDVLETGTAATSSRILVTRQTDGGTLGTGYSITRVNATSFTITSSSAAETSTVSWLMLNP